MVIKEIRFPDDVSYGSSVGPAYSTVVAQTGSGFESVISNWAAAKHRYNVGYGLRKIETIETVIAFFHAVRGRAFGFRYKDWADYKSCADAATPAATNQLLGTGDGSDTTFQLQKTYTYLTESYARTITKPVTGTTLVSIQNVTDPRWTVSTVTGIVTFSANITKTVTAITNAATAQVTATGHGLSIGWTVHFSSVSGMTQINGKRAAVASIVDADNFTISLNTTAYSAYTSGGSVNTIPQTSEEVRAGFEFDVPVRFESDLLSVSLDNLKVGAADVMLVEVRL